MKINKILFVRSSFYADNGKLLKATKLLDRLTIKNLAEMGLPLLAAYTPPGIKCQMIDDCLEELDFNSDAEVIAISGWLLHANRMIEIAKEFKKRGKIVVAGGYAVTMHPELFTEYMDSICIGEGDKIWSQMICDIESGTLKSTYESDFTSPLSDIPVPRYDLINNKRLFSLGVSYPVQATRGCPFKCDYCSIIAFYQRTYRKRPVQDVVRDIIAHGAKEMHFIDDNLMEDTQYAKELFREMKKIKRKITWGVQATINIAKDEEMLKLAYESGCRLVIIGLESISQQSLNHVSKSWNKVTFFKSAVQKIQNAGIGVHALIIFGLPSDTKEIFHESYKFLHDLNVVAAEFFILTPYPKTPLGQQYIKEGKIFDFDLSHYREPYVVFKHDTMSPKEIQDGYWHAYKEFYTMPRIIQRIIRGNYKHKLMQFALNYYYWVKIKRKIVPTHFQRGNYSFTKFPDVLKENGYRV